MSDVTTMRCVAAIVASAFMTRTSIWPVRMSALWHELWKVMLRFVTSCCAVAPVTAALTAMAEIAELSSNWRDLARRRLSSGKTEDWSRRLYGRDAAGL